MIRPFLALLSALGLAFASPHAPGLIPAPSERPLAANFGLAQDLMAGPGFHATGSGAQSIGSKVALNTTKPIEESNGFGGAKIVLVADQPTEGAAKDAPTAGKKLRIVLVGDSTVAKGSGWGPAFEKLLTPDTECINAAIGGRSSKSYRDEGHWEPALAHHPDYLLIQFGHNDQPGKGPERETDPNTTYYANMARYVDEARAAGAQPILVTSLARRTFTGTKIESTLIPYVEAVKKLAAEKYVPLVDLHARSIEQLEKMGPEAAVVFDPPLKEGQPPDHTHLGEKGGELVAPLVAEELRKAVPELAKHLLPTP